MLGTGEASGGITAPTGAGGRGTRRARKGRAEPEGRARSCSRELGRGSGERERGRCAVAARPRRTAAAPAGPAIGCGRAGDECRQGDDSGQRAGRHRSVPCPGATVVSRGGSALGARAAPGHDPGLVPASRRPAPSGAVPRTVAAGPNDGDGAAVACPPGTTNSAASTASAPSRAAGRLRPRSVRGWEVTGWSPSVDGLPSYRPAGPGPTGRAVSGGTGGPRRDPGRGRSAPG